MHHAELCLQALVKHLQGISDDQIPGFHVPIGIPVVYELDNDLNAVGHYNVGESKDSLRLKLACDSQCMRQL